MNCKCCGAWFSSSDASQELCAACRRALARVSLMIESLSAELEQVKRERDAAVEELKEYLTCHGCVYDVFCKKDYPMCDGCALEKCPCYSCTGLSNWQWRGLQEESHD